MEDFRVEEYWRYFIIHKPAMMSCVLAILRRHIMVAEISEIAPVAHLPLVLGMLRKLEGATIIDALLPPGPRNVLSCGHGVEALVLAILDGHHVLYKVGQRLEERGMLALLQADLTRMSLNDYRLGQIMGAPFSGNLHPVLGAAGPHRLGGV